MCSGSTCNLFSTMQAKAFPTMLRREIPQLLLQSLWSPLLLCKVMMFASCISWGTVPSSQHCSRSWWRWWRTVSPPALMISGGMPSFPGDLPQTRKSMALLSSSTEGGTLSSSKIGRTQVLLAAESVTVFSLE